VARKEIHVLLVKVLILYQESVMMKYVEVLA
jgi:hypothetical protein